MSDYVPNFVSIPEDDPSLDLCLSFNYPAFSQENKIEPEENKKEPNEPTEVFSCMFCDKKFSNPQSLGGHQNAHRVQRDQMKKEEMQKMGMDGSTIKTPMYPYATSQSSIYETVHRLLGIHNSAHIYKPYPTNMPRFGYNGHFMPSMVSPQNHPVVPNAVQSCPPRTSNSNGFNPKTWLTLDLTNQESMVSPQSYPVVPNAVQSCPPATSKLDGFDPKTWLTLDLTNQESSS